MDVFTYTLPAIRGIQAGKHYYVLMCPLELVPRLFPADVEGLRPELGYQRILTRSRIPEFVRYLIEHPKSYILSSLTASVNTNIQFDNVPGADGPAVLGYLKIPLGAKLLLHDGLHRRAAIEKALKSKAELAVETVSVVLFVDPGLRHAEQMFTDLKRNESHSARSRSIAGDHRDELARLVKALIVRVAVFHEQTEMARSTISNRSSKLFTFSGIYHATAFLLSGAKEEPFSAKLSLATDFWSEVANRIPDWHLAKDRKVTTAKLRKAYLHAHALALAAVARAGKSLLERYPGSWRQKLRGLSTLDWSRSNTRLWEGRAMIAGRLSKAHTCVILTGNVIKRHLGLPLLPEEEEMERRLRHPS
jgi:DNA sulfur modification protein DndB